MKKREILFIFVALFIASHMMTGCYSTGPTTVGVRTVKFGFFTKRGVQKEVYEQGATYFFLPILNDWHLFDTRLQNLEMVADSRVGDRRHKDDLRFKTRDGNDVSVDITVSWKINPQKAPYLLQNVGRSIAEIKDRLVRPICRTFVRDVFNELSSEDFYVAAKRQSKAQKSLKKLNKLLGKEGIIVEAVIPRLYRFNRDYQRIIQERKLAEQKAEKYKSAARAAEENGRRKMRKAEGQVTQRIAKAWGEFKQKKYRADGAYIRMRGNAQALLAEAKAKARAILERNKALAGSGGQRLVQLKIADSLKGKKIILLPMNQKSGVGVQTLDMNQLMKAVISKSYNKGKRK